MVFIAVISVFLSILILSKMVYEIFRPYANHTLFGKGRCVDVTYFYKTCENEYKTRMIRHFPIIDYYFGYYGQKIYTVCEPKPSDYTNVNKNFVDFGTNKDGVARSVSLCSVSEIKASYGPVVECSKKLWARKGKISVEDDVKIVVHDKES